MSAIEADTWFNAAADGNLYLPSHPDKTTAGDGQRLDAPNLRLEPANESQSSALNLPFLPAVHGVVVARGLFGQEDTALSAELACPREAGWLQENMFIDLGAHPELLGSLICIRHPPVVRDVQSRLGYTNGREVELVRICRWPQTDLIGYKILAVEQRVLGLSVPREVEIHQSLTELDWNGKSDRTAIALIHPALGLAWWREPRPFLRSFLITIGFVPEVRRIVQEIGKDGSASKFFDNQWRGSGIASATSLVGEEVDDQSPSSRAWRGEALRRQKAAAASLGLQWLDNAQAAQDAVREIISKARENFTVVDPYFGPVEVRDYVMAVSAGNVAIQVVTSEEHMLNRITPGGEQIFRGMCRIASELRTHGWRTDIFVMKGRRAPLHDRFLIADKRIWLSGNSLNAIGDRASVLIELPNPQEVLAKLQPILDGAEPFDVWRSKNEDHTNGGPTQSGLVSKSGEG